MKNFANNTLASIVTRYHQTVPVLEKYHLDFCCKGKRTLAEACNEKGLSLEDILHELEISTNTETSLVPYHAMNAEQLISYILIKHHFYVAQSLPIIINHLEKVAAKHGERFPYMCKVLDLFLVVNEEMTLHMHKEENILFPRIKEIAAIANLADKADLNANYINGPVSVMEHEHDQVGSLMYSIRELTNNYEVPEEACTTFRVVLAELKEFEDDLHTHVHIENNILFPMASKMLNGEILSVS